MIWRIVNDVLVALDGEFGKTAIDSTRAVAAATAVAGVLYSETMGLVSRRTVCTVAE
jgi:hypothetical protein